MPPCTNALRLGRVRARRWAVRADLLDRVSGTRQLLASGQSVADAALSAGLCVRHYERVFLDVVGQTPATYRRRARLSRAKQAIENGATVQEAREAAGYESPSSFAREFKAEFACSPMELCRIQKTGVPTQADTIGL